MSSYRYTFGEAEPPLPEGYTISVRYRAKWWKIPFLFLLGRPHYIGQLTYVGAAVESMDIDPVTSEISISFSAYRGD